MNHDTPAAREWALHGITRVHREMEIGEVTHCTYEERIIGPKIGDAVIHVIEKRAFDHSQVKLEEANIRIEKLKAECERMSKAYNCIKTEYDNYINGRPGDWYIVQLKQERDRYKEALERIAYDCEHFSAPDEREKLIQKCLDVASAALGQSESDGK